MLKKNTKSNLEDTQKHPINYYAMYYTILSEIVDAFLSMNTCQSK